MLNWLNRLAGGDFEAAAADSPRRRAKLLATVGLVAFSLLTLELLLARMYPFFLGNISAFLAIPVTMFGLSVGALVLHWLPGKASARWLPLLVPLLLLAALASFLLFFFLFNEVFNLTHYRMQNPRSDALKIAVLSSVFVPPFALGGIILSTAFTAAARQVGRLYAFDLCGSALACLLAPLLLQLVDLPVVICSVIAALGVATVVVLSARRGAVTVGAGALLIALVALAANQRVFVEKPDADLLGVRYAKGREVSERIHRWNAISRVALLRFRGQGSASSHRLIHDDGISNVIVRRHRPARLVDPPELAGAHGIPFVLDRPPTRALVMFAGCGQDMMRLLEFSGGELDVVGVEINPLVKRLVTLGDDPWNLGAFFAHPKVDLRIAEGRGYLEGDDSSYDLIFIASNGAQHAVRTGHVRKFLDTVQAMDAYLERLAPGGVIVFHEQPRLHKDEMFKRLLARRGGVAYEDAVMVLGRGRYRADFPIMTTVVKPDGFSADEAIRIGDLWEAEERNGVFYGPDSEPVPALADAIRGPVDEERFVPVDDHPYERPLLWSDFQLNPPRRELGRTLYALNWVKIFTTLFFTALALLATAAFYLRARDGRRLPAWLAGYFLLTGVAYMGAQVGLMAKLELFLGNPLYAISVVLASYLLANGAGAAWVGRREAAARRPSILLPAAGAAIAVPLTVLVVDGVLVQLLGWPLPVKVLLALLTVAPLAFLLGMFYPLGVSLAVDRGLKQLVPMTFGLATLSSVLGSTWAIVLVINHGLRSVILGAGVGYLLLAAVTLSVGFASRRSG